MRYAVSSLILMLLAIPTLGQTAEGPPQVGDTPMDFELPSSKGAKVRLSEVMQKGPVVLVVLRGYPGYQCPICTQQAGQFLAEAAKFERAGAHIVFVYPGPSKSLTDKAHEFLKNQRLPPNAQLVTDPDYSFTNAWHLRWKEPKETAYPSTFVIRDGKIAFAKISKSHDGRSSVTEVLEAVEQGQ